MSIDFRSFKKNFLTFLNYPFVNYWISKLETHSINSITQLIFLFSLTIHGVDSQKIKF